MFLPLYTSAPNLPIYNIVENLLKVTNEICNQGGIVAVNGFFTFNVTPIQIVAITSEVKRDKKREQQEYIHKTESQDFASTLNHAMEELQPSNVFVQTYNAKSQLQSISYNKQKEYSI